jgi:diguanylate cyclase (GGDEF)-like protein
VSIHWLLLVVVLIPTVALVAVTASVADARWSNRQAATKLRDGADRLLATMVALSEVTREGTYSAVFAGAAADGVSAASLDRVLGEDYAGKLTAVRAQVDHNAVVRSEPRLRADLAQAHALLPKITTGTVTLAQVTGLYDTFDDDLDARWRHQFAQLTSVAASSDLPSTFRQYLTGLDGSFVMFGAGIEQIQYANDLLQGMSSEINVLHLVDADGVINSAEQSIQGQLGPRAASAWAHFRSDPAARTSNDLFAEALGVGVTKSPSPYATDPVAYGKAFANGIIWLSDLIYVVTSASEDLSSLATAEAAQATKTFVLETTLTALITVVALALAALLARTVSRPLRRMSEAAETVHAGTLDVPPIDVAGPREIAETVTAFNDMTSTLRGVEGYALALAGDRNASRVPVTLPGPTGQALQAALDRLRESIHEAEEQHSKLEDLATHDPLTGLLNRRGAIDLMNRDRARIVRTKESMLVVFLDLDGLKEINDSYGHETGDRAIMATAATLFRATRTTDVVARFGGDEFLVAGIAHSGLAEVHSLADRILQDVRRTRFATTDGEHAIHCSIGVATTGPDGCDVVELVHRADAAMYQAKHEGRDRISWYEGVDGLNGSDGTGAPAAGPVPEGTEQPTPRVG